MRSMMRITCSSSWKVDVGQLDLAGALDVDLARAVDHDFGDLSSRSSGSSGPRPMISSVICSSMRARSARVRARPSSSRARPKASSISRRTSTWLVRSSLGSRSEMTRCWMRNLASRNDLAQRDLGEHARPVGQLTAAAGGAGVRADWAAAARVGHAAAAWHAWRRRPAERSRSVSVVTCAYPPVSADP